MTRGPGLEAEDVGDTESAAAGQADATEARASTKGRQNMAATRGQCAATRGTPPRRSILQRVPRVYQWDSLEKRVFFKMEKRVQQVQVVRPVSKLELREVREVRPVNKLDLQVVRGVQAATNQEPRVVARMSQ
jgi:hypothetical protein